MFMFDANASGFVYVANSGGQDISVFELGTDGGLRARDSVAIQRPIETGRSIVLALSPDNALLYAGYVSAESRALVATLAIDPQSGTPLLLASTPMADSVAYIATDRSGRFLLGASYAGDKVMVSSIASNGIVGETVQIVGTASKAHCILTDPLNRHVLHTSLGGDLIYQQTFDARTGLLSPNDPPNFAVRAGAGPRFMSFSRDSKFVYVINELDASIDVFPYDAARGLLGPPVQTVSVLPAGFSGKPWAADIHLTPDGEFLCASERTSSTLAMFRVDAARGRLTFLRSCSTVKQPRACRIDAAGRFLVCCGQLSNSLMIYSIDRGGGALTPLAEYPVGRNPTWVEIVLSA
jgi:6-phosphogluconolactonase